MNVAVVAGCTLCGGDLRGTRGARAIWKLVECARCGHVQTRIASQSPQVAEALQQLHFGDEFVAAVDRWTALFDRVNGRRVARDLKNRLPAGRVMEVGPGRGATLAALKTAGYQAEGIDVSLAVARNVAEIVGVPVHAGSLEALTVRSPRLAYDAVIMRHVLEHFAQPERALRLVAGILDDGRWLHVAVPHASAAAARFAGWTGYQPYHVHYFSVPNLVGLLERAGFTIERCVTREPFSGWFNALMNSALRSYAATPRRCATRSAMLRNAIQVVRLLFGLTSTPLRLVQGRLGYGEEIEVWAQKSAQ